MASKALRNLSQERKFGLLFALIFLACGLSFFSDWFAVATIFLSLSVLFFFFTVFLPRVLLPLTKAWLKLGELLHRVISPVVLMIMFFLILTPFALILRLFKGRPLELRFDSQASSYWKAKPHLDPRSMKYPF